MTPSHTKCPPRRRLRTDIQPVFHVEEYRAPPQLGHAFGWMLVAAAMLLWAMLCW